MSGRIALVRATSSRLKAEVGVIAFSIKERFAGLEVDNNFGDNRINFRIQASTTRLILRF